MRDDIGSLRSEVWGYRHMALEEWMCFLNPASQPQHALYHTGYVSQWTCLYLAGQDIVMLESLASSEVLLDVETPAAVE